MNRFGSAGFWRRLAVAAVAAGTGCAWAALGASPAPGAQAAGARPAAQATGRRQAVLAGPRYSVHVAVAADGSTVREYASADGIVFAVSWSTRLKPDFARLLGRYHAEYADAARAAAAAGVRRQLALHGGDLVVRSAGQLNRFVGQAWAPSLVPEGVDASTLR